jgi:signal transduction histidine kinase
MNIERKFVLGLVLVLGGGCVAIYTFWLAQASLFAPLTVVLGVGLLASAMAHYSLFRPVRQLAVMAKAVGAGDFSKRLGLERRDEIGSLAAEMDTMCDQLEAARRAAEAHIVALEQLRHSDRVATLGRLASSVAHELGNPLNVIELRAQMIASGDVGTLQQAQLNAAVIAEQAQRMTRIIGQVLSFARMQPSQLRRLDLVNVLRKAISLTDHISKQHKTSVHLDAHRSRIALAGDPDKLLQVVVNLLVNGIQASPEAADLHIRTSELTRASADDPDGDQQVYVCVEVIDQGAGIAAQLLSKVFDPFFSTRIAEGGTGLGLSVAQGIAREHEGWIVANSEPGQGACFQVYLPQRRMRSEEIVDAC